MHTSAKHCFEVVWTHLGVFRAVKSRFSWFSMVLQGFGSPGRPSWPWAARGQPSCRRAVSERGFGRFFKLRARIWKIFQAQSKDLEDCSSSEQGFGRFSKNLQDSRRMLIEFAVFSKIFNCRRGFRPAGQPGAHWISLDFLIFLDYGRAWPEAWRCGSRWISNKILRKT